MPSGAKKRKAAKKKKEKQSNVNPSTDNPQGSDDLKSQDGKRSDGGEVSSHADQDHDDHHHSDNEESEEVEERDPSEAHPSVSDSKSMEEVPSDLTSADAVGGKEDSVLKIERDLKSEEGSDSKNVSVEHIKSTKDSCYGNENSSGTSNDKSLNEKNPKDEPSNSKQEAIACEDSISVYSSPSEMTLIAENAPVEGNLVVEPSVNSVKTVASMCEVKSSDNGSALLEKTMVSQVATTDLAMKRSEDKIYPLPDKHVRTSSLEEPEPEEYDSKVSAPLCGNPVSESTKGAEFMKDSETPQHFENQPLIASAPRLVQKTSWFSCCGLFEVLSGSDR